MRFLEKKRCKERNFRCRNLTLCLKVLHAVFFVELWFQNMSVEISDSDVFTCVRFSCNHFCGCQYKSEFHLWILADLCVQAVP